MSTAVGTEVLEEAPASAGAALAARGGRPAVRSRTGKSNPTAGMSPQQAAEFERLHPRAAKGRTGGGQFAVKQGAGMEGAPDDQVREVQRRINTAGTGRVVVDGRFGPVTAEAVRHFQRQAGLNANGIVDRNTYEALTNPPPLSRQEVVAQERADAAGGSRRLGRADAQSRRERGGSGGGSGGGTTGRSRSGSETRLDPTDVHAIEDFQREHGLKVDGVIGPDTQRALRRERERGDGERRGEGRSTRGTGTLRRGDGGKRAGKQVKAIQQMLQDLGYDLGDEGTDGEFGSATEAALKKMQDDYGLDPDGVVGPRTRKLLNRLRSRLKAETRQMASGKAPRDDYKLVEGQMIEEATLTAAARKALPKSAFVFPERAPESGSYPIHDEGHAKAALARVKQHGSPDEQAKVRAAVKRRYPNLLQEGEALHEDAWGGKPGTNWKQVGPEAKKKLSPLIKHYMGKPHPFTACVRDNSKRFGEERAKKVCAVLKDLGARTTKWRKGPKGKAEEAFLEEVLIDLVEAGLETEADVDLIAGFLQGQLIQPVLYDAHLRLEEAVEVRKAAKGGDEFARARARERVLREAVGALHGLSWEARLHPRDREGRFRDVIGSLAPGSSIDLPGNVTVGRLADTKPAADTFSSRMAGLPRMDPMAARAPAGSHGGYWVSHPPTKNPTRAHWNHEQSFHDTPQSAAKATMKALSDEGITFDADVHPGQGTLDVDRPARDAKHEDLKRRLKDAESRGDTASIQALRRALAKQGSIAGVRAERKPTPASAHLEQKVNYGGVPTARGDVLKDLERKGVSPAARDRYMQGLETGAKARAEAPAAAKPEVDTAAIKAAPLSDLAAMIQRDWSSQGKGVNFAAKPYLEAMRSLTTVRDRYGMDPGESIVAYFLSNATSWKGPTAKAVKTELRRRLKGGR